MDLSQYVKKTGNKVYESCVGLVDETIIEKEVIAKLLDAKRGQVHIYSVFTSVYFDKKSISGGFFATAYNLKKLLSKNLEPAKAEFERLYNNIQKELWEIERERIKFNKNRIDDKKPSSVARAVFHLNAYNNLKSLEMGLTEPLDVMRYGDKLMLGLNSVYLPLDNFKYSDTHKAICWTYEDYIVNYFPVVLD